MDKFYTVSDFAKILDVSQISILKMIKAKRLHPINIGCGKRPNWRIPEEDILRLKAEAFTQNEES